ncbi:MAG: lipopolysaccharide biosynthesis protein [Mariniphaga sp.]|nr:lipopolysaccharide biosynthesis protein [Mariniphaga sp.]
MSLKSKTINGLGWDFSGRFLSQIVGFIISIILARLLSPNDFGILAMINVVVAIATVFIDFGFGTAIVQKSNIKDEHYSTVFIFNISVGLFLSFILFFSSGLIAKFYDSEIIKDVGRVMSLIFIINALGSVVRIKLYKEMNFRILSIGGIFGSLIGGILGMGMAFSGFGVWSLVFQALTSSLLTSTYFFMKSRWVPKIQFHIQYLKELWAYSSQIFISTMVGVIFGQLDNLVIGKLFPPATLGYYYRAKSMESLIYNYTSASLLTVLFPSLSSVKDDKFRFNNIIFKTFHILSYFSFFILGYLYLVSEDIIIMLFGSKWMPSVELFRLLLLSSFVYPFGALFNSILQSSGNSKALLKLTIIRYSLLIPTYFLLLYFGLKIFLYSFVVLTVITLIYSIQFIAKEIRISSLWFYRSILPNILLNIVLTFGIYNSLNIYSAGHFVHFLICTILFVLLNIVISKVLKIEGFGLIIAEFKSLKK